MRKQYLIMITFVFIGLTSCFSQSKETYVGTHYSVSASINPASGYMEASVDIHFFPEEAVDTLRFLIHGDLTIKRIKSSIVDEYKTEIWDPGMPVYIKEVTIPLLKTAIPGEPVLLSWKYKGELNNDHLIMGASAIFPKWTELPMESMWVPIEASFRQRFSFDSFIKLPDGYTLISNGSFEKNRYGWKVNSRIAGPDIPIIISNEMQIRHHLVEEEGLSFSIYHAGASDTIVNYVEKHTIKILNHYEDLFAHGRLTEQELSLAISPLDLKLASSYARPGFISLQYGINLGPELLQLIAHETAHLWWFHAQDVQSRHNFLNESFAEYLSWLEVRKVYGDLWFNNKLISVRQAADKSPGFNEWTFQNNTLLTYFKGPLLLKQLHEKIGDDQFQKLLKELLRQQVSTIEEMLLVLSKISDESIADWFKKKLKSTGV